MKKRSYFVFITVFAFAISINAQIVPPPIPPPPPPGLPIDGGLFFLLISGLAYGAKKLKK